MANTACTKVFSLATSRFAASPGRLDDCPCPGCAGCLDVHQPDARVPERLLGVCTGCGRWFAIELGSAGDESAMLHLPGAGE